MPYWRDGDVLPEYQRDALGGIVDGVLAEQIVLPWSSVVRLPDYLSYEEAATLPCAAVTAWHALFEAQRLRPGSTVLLLGTGGVSIFGLQLAAAAGMRTIVTSSSDAKLEKARALGAHHTINYREREDWDRAVLDLTNGRGVDVVLEVGGVGTFPRSNNATRVGGSISIIGALAPDEGGGLAPLIGGGRRATRISVGSRRMFEDMNRLLEVTELHPVIDRVFDFDQAREAYRYLESQQHLGKVVVRV
jgi:NADPH:quinone reductase-like Zn-dependent oxidoreductase